VDAQPPVTPGTVANRQHRVGSILQASHEGVVSLSAGRHLIPRRAIWRRRLPAINLTGDYLSDGEHLQQISELLEIYVAAVVRNVLEQSG